MRPQVKTGTLLVVSAALEAAIGLALLLAPSIPASLLLGAALSTSAAVTVARVAGAALLALGIACFLARAENASRAIVIALLVYNSLAVLVLAHAGLVLGLSGIGLWPTVVLHAAMGAWCLACWRSA